MPVTTFRMAKAEVGKLRGTVKNSARNHELQVPKSAKPDSATVSSEECFMANATLRPVDRIRQDRLLKHRNRTLSGISGRAGSGEAVSEAA